MERKERIFAYMKSKDYIPLTKDELAAVLDVPHEDMAAFEQLLSELEQEGKIMQSKKGRYTFVRGADSLASGKLRCNGRGFFAFLLCDEEGADDIYINGKDLAGAIDADRVLAHIDGEDKRTGRKEGHVIKILERGNESFTGIFERETDGICLIKCDNERIYTKLSVRREDMMGAEIGQRVAVRLTDYRPDGAIFGIVVKVLGDADSISGNIEAILYEHAIRQEFPDEVIEQAESIGQEVSEQDIQGRYDLRDQMIFTIDGDDARDFDDAVSVDRLDNGHYRLGVHIADVTHYVTEGTPLDDEAFIRGTSVYLADRVIPMLPKVLSNGICSLNPHVDRLTLSVFMEIDGQGKIVSHSLHKSVICSVERMTYRQVTKLIEGTDEALTHTYEALVPTLKTMAELAKILHEKRERRGSINFDFPESAVIVDEMGEPTDIVRVEREVSHKLIEEFMLAANETIAEYAFWSEIPFVYRVHEPPSIEKIEEFNRFIANFGLKIKGKIDEDNPVHPKALQKVLDEIAGTPEELMISTYMLRSLMKARYAPQNLGHFGLAAKYYTHFTSPIRRYPDLAIHRILKEFMDGKLQETRIQELKEFTYQASEVSSEREVGAELAERDVDDLMKAVYMSRFIGQSFEARVSGVTNFGMFVELENSVEGLIRLEQLKDDYYDFDEQQRRLIGERTKKIYKIGDKVEVTLIKTDMILRQIDFMLTKDATPQNIASAQKAEVRKKERKQRDISRVSRQKGKKGKSYSKHARKIKGKKKRKK